MFVRVAQVTYLAAKKGVNTLPDGRVFEAGTVDTMKRQLAEIGWKEVTK